ncbi:MAG: S-layer homology domain-containing protein, partial [bacterium]|nr:S-layer homology domain-containing protein [bacterium]
TWTQNGEADMASYDVWETEVTEGIATNVLNAACQNNACTATLSSLSAGTAYGIQIIAIDADGNRSAGSTVVSTATLGTSGGRSPTTNRSSNNTTPSSTDSTVAAAPAPAPAGGGGGGSGGGATIAATSTHNAAATSPERTLHEGSIQTVLSAAVHAAAEDGNLEGSEGTAITAQTLLTRVFLSEAEDLRVLDLSAAPLQIAAEATELRGTDLSQQSSAQVALLTTAGASVRAVYLQEGSSWNGDFQAPRVVERSSAAVNVSNDEDLTGRDVSADNVTIVEVGAGAGVSLEFTSAQTLVMPAPAQADVGSTYEVYSSLDGTQWVRESGAVTYDASSGTVSLAISHATYFMVVAVDAEISTVRPVPKSYQPTSSVDDRSQRNIDREYAAQGMASQAWSKPYLEKLVERGIVEGNGRYEPQRSINRAEFLRIVLDALEVDLLTSTEKPFSDVDVSAWYASYVHTAKMNGWVKGYPDGTFGGGQFLNRAEAMVIIARVAGLNVDAATPSSLFTDVPRRSWFGPAVYYAYSQALVKGIGNDRFDPDSTLTKAQIAKIMVNLLYHLGRIE